MLENPWIIWLIIGLVGLGTFALRSFLIFTLDKLGDIESLRKILRYIPSAVLGALVSLSLFTGREATDTNLIDNRWIAALIAALVAWKTRNMLLTIVTGMGLLIILNHQ